MKRSWNDKIRGSSVTCWAVGILIFESIGKVYGNQVLIESIINHPYNKDKVKTVFKNLKHDRQQTLAPTGGLKTPKKGQPQIYRVNPG